MSWVVKNKGYMPYIIIIIIIIKNLLKYQKILPINEWARSKKLHHYFWP